MITSITQTRSGNATFISVVSSLTGTVYFHWYLDGTWLGYTTSPLKTIVLAPGEQAKIDVLDTTDPAFDFVASAPAGFPSRRVLQFVRSTDAATARYKIEQQLGGGAWTVLGYMQHDPRRWVYSFTTPRLADLTSYSWRVTALDAAGNAGTPVALGTELIVRTPDAPGFAIVFDAVHDQVQFVAA